VLEEKDWIAVKRPGGLCGPHLLGPLGLINKIPWVSLSHAVSYARELGFEPGTSLAEVQHRDGYLHIYGPVDHSHPQLNSGKGLSDVWRIRASGGSGSGSGSRRKESTVTGMILAYEGGRVLPLMIGAFSDVRSSDSPLLCLEKVSEEKQRLWTLAMAPSSFLEDARRASAFEHTVDDIMQQYDQEGDGVLDAKDVRKLVKDLQSGYYGDLAGSGQVPQNLRS